jgi:phosphoglycerol transferase MdoB-like AlkP superfamily enzyme
MQKSFGYDMYHSVGDFGIEGTAAELDSNMIENDELYGKMTGEAPFFSFVITYSAHLPYTGDSAKLSLAREYYPQMTGEADDELNNIRILAADTDKFFGRLTERLEEDGLMDDTVIVAFTDHFAYGVSDEKLLADCKGDTLKYTVPAFIYAKGITPVTIDKPMMTIDWTPTLVNLFGLDNSGEYIGNDIMNPDNDGFAYFETRDWMDGDYHYVQSERKAPAEHLVKIIDNNRRVKKQIEVNDIIVTGDYYGQK